MSKIIATVFGVGYLRPASGTWGSLAALPMFWGLYQIGGAVLTVIASLVVFIAGWWATKAMTSGSDNHDPSEIVVDEVAGQWVALLPVAIGSAHAGADVLALYPGWIAAFVLFRLFDIWKPGPVGWADRRNDAFGVMMDDVIAGVFAGIGVIVLAGISHGLLM